MAMTVDDDDGDDDDDDYGDDYDLGNAEDADRADLRGGFFEYIKII